MTFEEIIQTYEKAKALSKSNPSMALTMMEQLSKETNCPKDLVLTILRDIEQLKKVVKPQAQSTPKPPESEEPKKEIKSEDVIKMVNLNEIKLIKELEDLIPISDEDFNRLEQGILEDGIQMPLVVTPDMQLLAGYNRYRIAKKHAISPVPVIIKNIPKKDYLSFAIKDNLERRQLSPEDVIAIVSKFKLAGRGRPAKYSREKTTAELAEMLGVSHSTIDRARAFIKKVEEGVDTTNKSIRSVIEGTEPAIHKTMSFEFVMGINLDEETISSQLATVADEIFNLDPANGDRVKVAVQMWLVKK